MKKYRAFQIPTNWMLDTGYVSQVNSFSINPDICIDFIFNNDFIGGKNFKCIARNPIELDILAGHEH